MIEAKRKEYIDEITVEDVRELMCPELGKWGKIALILNSSKGEGDVERDRDSCKYKWNTLLSDFKKIWDYHSRTGTNSEEYFKETTAEEKKTHKLPKTFYLSAYRNMAEWLRDKATMNPPHVRDTMDPHDGNYNAPLSQEVGPGTGFLDSMSDEGWVAPLRRAASHIDLTAEVSPAVSYAQSMHGMSGHMVGGLFQSRASPHCFDSKYGKEHR